MARYLNVASVCLCLVAAAGCPASSQPAGPSSESAKNCFLSDVEGEPIIVGRTAQEYRAGDFFAERNAVELAEAAQMGRLACVSELVAGGANPNARGYHGITPLIYAMSGISLKGFRRLLELGADPNLQMENGDSVMTLSAERRDPEALKLALAFGGNPNLRRSFKPVHYLDFSPTPLFVTLHYNRLENARILIKAGADVNGRTFDGGTALMEAAIQDRYDMMYVLLEAGADPRARNNNGVTASYHLIDCNLSNQSAETVKWRQRCMGEEKVTATKSGDIDKDGVF
jgi:ankyrin repeat protein